MKAIALAEAVDFYRIDASLKLDPDRRAALGQYMTPVPISRFMASLFSETHGDLRVLDPGAAASGVEHENNTAEPSPTTEMDRWGRVKQPLRAMQPRAVADAIRVGAAVSMAQRGASLVAMQQAGGWRSPDMPAHYARQAAASRGAVATLRPEDRWA